AMPNTMSGIDGGMRMPRDPEVATRPVENFFGYPFFTIAGIISAPTATTVAGDDPETAAKNMQASTVVIAIPPRRWPTMAAPKSVRRREIPPRDMMFAARMKNGIAISGNELSALNRRSETWVIGMSVK